MGRPGDDPRYAEAARAVSPVVVGHVRQASVGGVSEANTHPFVSTTIKQASSEARLASVAVTLPPVIGVASDFPGFCPAPQAQAGTCPASSGVP